MTEVRYYFDMDGVIADWVAQFNEANIMSLEDFNALSREEREVLKQDFFTYEFFRTMPPLERGLQMLRDMIASGETVCVLSATGRVNRDVVTQAKIDWLAEHVGCVDAMFVDKVEMKSQRVINDAVRHILIDDRVKAIEAWEAAGYEGVLFA